MKVNSNSRFLTVILLSFLTLSFLSFIPKHLGISAAVADEICDNAIDDDNDGLIDLNDPDCECEVIEPISLIPNPSFEDMSCCPTDRNQLECAQVWIQASEPTTDYIHNCGWPGWNDYLPPTPFPDGDGIMGFRDGRIRNTSTPERNWKEYAGACLLGPLVADSSYRFEFHVGFSNNLRSPPINITFFGTSDCNNLPFGQGNPALGCPTNGPNWVNLGSTLVSGDEGNKWVKASIEVTPEEDITAIAIGPDCPGVPSTTNLYYFFDNLLLADFRSFELQIKTLSHPCNDNFSLEISNNPDYSYQWYKEGIALIGETSPQLSQMYGEGDYQVRILEGQACRVSKGYLHRIPTITNEVSRTICKDATYSFGNQLLTEAGMYIDTFKSINNCDSIVSLNLNVLGALADTVHAKIFEGESYALDDFSFNKEGDHLVQLVSSQGCDSLVLLRLEFFHVFIPNVFTPNDDGFNDLFRVYGGDGLIESRQINIYNRWGAEVSSGAEWDGRFKGEFVNSGVFLYVAKLIMNDGVERQFTGSVTVLR